MPGERALEFTLPDFTGLPLKALKVERYEGRQFSDLSTLTMLTSLQIERCHGIHFLPSLSSCSALQNLTLHRCTSIQSLPAHPPLASVAAAVAG